LTGLVQLLGEVDARAIRVHLAKTVGWALSGDSIIVETLSSCRITVVKSAIDVVIAVDTGVLARWSIGCQHTLSFSAKIVGSTIRAIAIVIDCDRLAASTHKVTDRCLAFACEILRSPPSRTLTVGRARSRAEFRHQESELATKTRIATILCAVLLIVTEDVLDGTIRNAVRNWNTFSGLAQVGGQAVLLTDWGWARVGGWSGIANSSGIVAEGTQASSCNVLADSISNTIIISGTYGGVRADVSVATSQVGFAPIPCASVVVVATSVPVNTDVVPNLFIELAESIITLIDWEALLCAPGTILDIRWNNFACTQASIADRSHALLGEVEHNSPLLTICAILTRD